MFKQWKEATIVLITKNTLPQTLPDITIGVLLFCGFQVVEVCFLRVLGFPPRRRSQKCLDLCQPEKSLITLSNWCSDHCNVQIKLDSRSKTIKPSFLSLNSLSVNTLFLPYGFQSHALPDSLNLPLVSFWVDKCEDGRQNSSIGWYDWNVEQWRVNLLKR